ncbi:hypothetical protein P389DRAFT_65365 [Cystobasidium minutum MCA 4210]|uniref:uncharacterized protein n=1 Tax=Cystobasidium minutum MCA 4210 TaxID=1397322 RepID=UPI0034CF72D1|eukprot:jgi/Rhomi1/65365/CE65364_495
MVKSIFTMTGAVAVTLFALVSANGPGHQTGLEVRQPYTNAEAFARGLPPLRPRHRGSRTWTAVKRQQSSGLRFTTLKFDDESFSNPDGPVPLPYQGVGMRLPWLRIRTGLLVPRVERSVGAECTLLLLFWISYLDQCRPRRHDPTEVSLLRPGLRRTSYPVDRDWNSWRNYCVYGKCGMRTKRPRRNDSWPHIQFLRQSAGRRLDRLLRARPKWRMGC